MNKIEQIIQSEKQHILITGGRRSGLTYSLLMKALHTRGNVVFVSGFDKDSGNALNQAVNILKDHNCQDYNVGVFRFSRGKVLRTKQNTITFINEDKLIDYFWLKPNLNLICVDQPEQLPSSVVKNIILYKDKQDISKAFATQPFNCAYRNPEYVNGIVVRDENGNPYYEDYSWDKELLNWNTVDKDNVTKRVITKLDPSFYKGDVDVIMLDNPKSNHYSENLPWEARQLLRGEWEEINK